MQATEIRRVKFGDDILSSQREDLAINAKNILGYNRLAAAAGTTSLIAALRRLEIIPLVQLEVDTYKASKRKKGMWEGHFMALAIFLPIFVVCLLACTYLIEISNASKGLGSWIESGGAVACGVIAALSFILFLASLLDSSMRGDRKIWDWKKFPIAEYQGAIPEYVLEKALQIKKVCPSAEFEIDHLMIDTERGPDPFLVVQAFGESYYVDVWDEKEYESKL